ncbi:DUF6160 family protein [Marinobacter salicampi]|uniref:DUF6160 family protein n=1 Tax=Marinobacter salicampi TaxID=435907 RepID=UPI00140E7D76|nr:DUF6160 family protein [Marinobacter salicampi]
MKGLKRTLLALGIVGLPVVATADLTMLDDSALGDITGQAGVSIELETKVDIGQFSYTDEGTLAINDISIGGANRTNMFGFNGMGGPEATERLDNIRIDIDILADGDAAINIVPTYFNAIDFRVTTGAWDLLSSDGSNSSTQVLNNFMAEGVLGRGEIHIDTNTDVMRFATAFGIETMEFDVPFLAIGVRGMSITGANYDPVFRNPMDVFAEVELFIYAGQRLGSTESSLAIDMPVFEADIGIEQVIVGQQSIGQIFVDDLSITNTAMSIYGH